MFRKLSIIRKELLARHTDEGEIMLKRVVSIDETWIRSFEPELKRQSSEWLTPNSLRPMKFRRSLNNRKMLMILVYDINGLLTLPRVPQGQTVNKEYYGYSLRHIPRPAIRRKRPELLEATLLILQDNATCHKAGNIRAVSTEYNWEVLQHPSYSPDLSPCDYDLFLKIKLGIHHDDLDELYAAVNGVIRGINVCCLPTGI